MIIYLIEFVFIKLIIMFVVVYIMYRLLYYNKGYIVIDKW